MPASAPFSTPAVPPRLGVSRCLLGERCRYDGSHKRTPLAADFLAPFVTLVPLCPEVDAGLPVPRPPVRLVKRGEIRAVGVADERLDVTDCLRGWCRQALEAVPVMSGYLLKGRSPSCGVGDVPIEGVGTGSGIFAQSLLQHDPSLPVASVEQLADPLRLSSFLEAVSARHRFIHWFHKERKTTEIKSFFDTFHWQLLSRETALPGEWPQASAHAALAHLIKQLQQRPTHKGRLRVLRRLADLLTQPSPAVMDAIEAFNAGWIPFAAPLLLLMDSLNMDGHHGTNTILSPSPLEKIALLDLHPSALPDTRGTLPLTEP